MNLRNEKEPWAQENDLTMNIDGIPCERSLSALLS